MSDTATTLLSHTFYNNPINLWTLESPPRFIFKASSLSAQSVAHFFKDLSFLRNFPKTFNNNKSEHLTITIPTRSCQHCHTVEKLGHLAWNIRTPIRTRFDFLPHEINSRKENIQTWNWENSDKSTQAITQCQGNQGCLFICPHLPHHSKPAPDQTNSQFK